MVFSNLYFIFAFLPLNLLLYYLAPTDKMKNSLLIVFSLVFYAWGEPVWIILLLFSAMTDYIHGRIIDTSTKPLVRKSALISSIFINLGLLSVFKYADFFIESINTVCHLNLQGHGFSLPIGISFYTFQTLSYVIDVYRREVPAQRSFIKFLMYVSLFHQLVAGPIVRYKDIAKEIEERVLSLKRFNYGVVRFVIGLSKKVIIANTAGSASAFFLDRSFEGLSVLGAWFGILLFSLQIYYDFSGYSDMAIGLGHMFGFTYRENFNYPYISKSATEFWRRWHISLGSFFRDYVYIPLGGKRLRMTRNLFIVWLLTGLWHGASWNFVLWGLYYGFLIMVERKFLLSWMARLPKVVGHLYLITAVLFGWVLFYFSDVHRIFNFTKIMVGFGNAPLYTETTLIRIQNNMFFTLVAILLCTPLAKTLYERMSLTIKQKWGESLEWNLSNAMNSVVTLIMLVLNTALLIGQTYNPFLYFRF